MSTFKKDLISGSFYIGIAKYAGIICQIVVTAMLARILTPDDYGVIAISMVFIAFFNVLSDIGIGVAVIQRKDFTNRDLDHLYSLNVYIGLLLSLAFYSSAGIISQYYANEQLFNVCRLLCLLVFFTCARTVPMNQLYREKKFKYVAFTNLSVQIVCGVVAIVAALFGWGVYALVLSHVLSAFLLFIIYSIKYKRHFFLCVDITPLKRVFSYSAFNFFGTIFIYLTLNIDKLLVGKFLGAKSLGFYEKSYSLVFLPISNITFVITPVLHPLFSEFQDSLNELANKFFKIIEVLAYISFPLSVIFFFTSKELILLFYGNQWYPAIQPFQIMSLAISFLILDTTVGSIYNAANETKRSFFTMLIMSCVMLISIIIAIYYVNTIISVAWAFLFAKIVGTFINFYSLTQGLGVNFSYFWRCIYKPLVVSLGVCCFMYLLSLIVNTDGILFALIIKAVCGMLVSTILVQFISGYNLIAIVESKVKSLRVGVNDI